MEALLSGAQHRKDPELWEKLCNSAEKASPGPIGSAAFLIIALGLSGCASIDNEKAEAKYKGNPIIGTWSIEMNRCKETYKFRPDGIRICSSNLEIVKSSYEISNEPSDRGFYKITDKVLEDNGKRDCSGGTEDMTGDVVNLFVKFNPQMNKIVFCEDESLNKCFGPFMKNN